MDDNYLSSIAIGVGGDMALVSMPVRQEFTSPRAWTSADGLKWKSVKVPAGKNWAGVATIGDRLLAVDRFGGAVLPGSGDKWKATKKRIKDKGARTDAITSTPTGAAVAGWNAKGPMVWTTADGVDWSATALPAHAGWTAFGPSMIAATPSGVLAAAAGGSPGSVKFPPQMWSAPDGVNWQAVPVPVIDDKTVVASLTATPIGLLLVLRQVEESKTVGSTIWSSVDGITWQQVHRTDSLVGATSVGPLGVIMSTPTTLLRSTDDGATWSETALPTDLGGAPVVLLAQTPDGRLIVGTSFAEDGAGIWVGSPAP